MNDTLDPYVQKLVNLYMQLWIILKKLKKS